jgi:spore coat protein U-like protein
MTGSKNKASLNYVLSTTSDGKTNWDDIVTSGGHVITGTGTGSSVAIPVYGVLAANQTLVADSYSDSITATITY